MVLETLNVLNYRSLQQVDLQFSQGINCFVGANGAGKTNLLDAVYYLSFCKSFINPIDSQHIRHGQDFFVIQGHYQKNGASEEVYCGLKGGQKKQFRRNKKEYSKLSEHIGFVPLVVISPADEQLIMEGSEWRRKFIDGVISQSDKTYLDTLIRYGRVLLQRNKLLKDIQGGAIGNFDILDALDIQLVHAAQLIFKHRASFIEELLPVFSSHFINISGGSEEVGIVYRSSLADGDFLQQLKDTRQRDVILGYTSRGIHKDDLEFTLFDHPLKREGSQGQKKTFAIALKLAQFDFLAAHHGVKPILLLDDIFDKLDEQRGKSLVRLVAEDHFSQIFITDTQQQHLETILSGIGKPYRMFHMQYGSVICEKD